MTGSAVTCFGIVKDFSSRLKKVLDCATEKFMLLGGILVEIGNFIDFYFWLFSFFYISMEP